MPSKRKPTTAPSLRHSLLLSALPESARMDLLAQGRRLYAPKGSTIFAMGTDGTTALLIETGRVTISLSSARGRHTILDHLGPGEVVGDLAVLDGGKRSADALAGTDVTGTLLSQAVLHGILKRHPDTALALITALTQRLRNTNEAYAFQTMADGAVRLSRVMLRLFDRWGTDSSNNTLTLEMTFSQTELGDMSGLTRESVNRLMRRLISDGVMMRNENSLILLDRDALAKRARVDEFSIG